MTKNPFRGLSQEALLKACLSALNEIPNTAFHFNGERTNTYALASAIDNPNPIEPTPIEPEPAKAIELTPVHIMPSGLAIFIAPTTREDPAYNSDLMTDDEACLCGSYGHLVFDRHTGKTLRYYKGANDKNRGGYGEYSDITKIDVANYRDRNGNPIAARGYEDITYIGQWTAAGEYLKPAEPINEPEDEPISEMED